MHRYVALILLFAYFGYALTDDIDDPLLAISGAKFPPFESPKVITLFSQPQPVIQDHPSNQLIEDRCRITPSQDKQSPVVFVLPSSDPSPTKPFPSPPSKAIVTATVTSAFQMESFIQSLAMLLGNARPAAPTSMPVISSLQSTLSSLPLVDHKRSQKITTSVIHVTSTIVLSTQGCPLATPTVPAFCQNICPAFINASLSPSSSSSSSGIGSMVVTNSTENPATTMATRTITPTAFATMSHVYPSIATASMPSLSTVTISTCQNQSNAFTANVNQEYCLMITIPHSGGQNMVIQVPKPNNKCAII